MLKPKNAFGDHYQLKKLIDDNGLGQVWEAISAQTATDEIVAIKIFPTLDEAGIKYITEKYLEANYLDQLNWVHAHLLPATNIGLFKKQLFFEMHFCNSGSLEHNTRQLTEKDIAKCLYQVASAIACLHRNFVIHQCIKPANILLDDNNYYCYLPDLGMDAECRQIIEQHIVTTVDDPVNLTTSFSGKTQVAKMMPPCYLAPELFIEPHKHSAATDVWAFGATIYEIASGNLPFGNLGGQAQQGNEIIPNLPAHFSASLNKLIKRCLSKNAAERPTANEIRQSAENYFNSGSYKLSFNDDLVENNLSNYPLIFINQKAEVKPILWKKIAIWVCLLIAIGTGIYFLLDKQLFSDAENSFTVLPQQPAVKDTSYLKITDTIQVKDPGVIQPQNTSVVQPENAAVISVATAPKAPVNIVNRSVTHPANRSIVTPVLKESLQQQKNIATNNTPQIEAKQKNVFPVNIKQKASKQPLDPGVPRHKDAEQKVD